MKNSKLVKLLLVTLMVAMIGIIGTEVFAAEGENYDDLQQLLNNTTSNNGTTANNTTASNTTSNNTTNNTAKNNSTLNTSAITNSSATNNVNNTTNTALPKTGVESSTGMIVLITVCGISAIYAFKKIRDYKSL